MQGSFKLTPGAIYNVRIRGQAKTTRRVFKSNEKRVFRGKRNRVIGEIPCFVFTSPVPKAMTSEFDAATQTLRFGGLLGSRGYPATEVSVPHFDLLSCVVTAQN